MKYFVVSDVHSYYTYLENVLNKAKFDKNNPNHFFVSLGDLLDRGDMPRECLKFVLSLDPSRRALVRGNHEDLLENIVKTESFKKRDFTNGTMGTLSKLANIKYYEFYEMLNRISKDEDLYNYYQSLVDYYEIEDYVFIHGWIAKKDSSYKEWRKASREEFNEARWMNGFDAWDAMKNDEYKEKKTIVCGHFHTSYGHSVYHHLGKDILDDLKLKNCHFEPFVDDGIIGLDACSALSHKMNLLVIDDQTKTTEFFVNE